MASVLRRDAQRTNTDEKVTGKTRKRSDATSKSVSGSQKLGEANRPLL